MNHERLCKILLKQHTSEKTENLNDNNKHFVFKVIQNAEKDEVKNAVEYFFGVKVNEVRLLNVKGKVKQFRQKYHGKRKNWKKAYVTLLESSDIELEKLLRKG